ncbi:helix-turn-helix transcriptional regulator [Halalkalibacter urbisdiaboli]|uniref:helix-turn-helix transcriptional regulator n=1 Tax=Halalkalibacter urbisdiaboli TaxID=1960589 RepID=UPI000B43122E|nr:AraC family transcriptional regulator [Halalkalibacter urbisdiaboli]
MEKETLHEARVHGDPMFQLSVYKVDYVNQEAIFDFHWHYEIEFIYMEQGEASFQVGTTLFHVQEGEGLFVPSEELHAAHPISDRPFTLYAIVFNLNLLNSQSYDSIQQKYIDLLQRTAPPFPTYLKGEQDWERVALGNLLEIIQLFQTKDAAYELRIKAELFRLLATFIETSQLKPEPDPAEREKIARLKQVLQYISTHYQTKLTVRELAAHIGMSEGHFSRFFKALVHKTPIEYVNHVRVNQAAKLLLETNRKILDIAMEVGFDNQSYFIKTFKQQKQCTPKDFRKLNHKQN